MIEIKLNNGMVSLVDDIDADLAELKWTALVQPKWIYAVRSERRKSRYMHRVILARELGIELTQYQLVDHINGNALDNRRENLRLSSHSQNMRNRKSADGSTSKYLGVCIDRKSGKWVAKICHNKRTTDLGRFANEDDAARAYDAAAKQLHGDFARLNFPENDQ